MAETQGQLAQTFTAERRPAQPTNPPPPIAGQQSFGVAEPTAKRDTVIESSADPNDDRMQSEDAAASVPAPVPHESPWYADGLAFACTQCGQCCTGGPGAVWVTETEIDELSRLMGVSYGEVLLNHTRLIGGRRSLREFANGDCTFLDPDTRRCRVYAARPLQCRTWPFWPEHLARPESWQHVKTICPGIDRGDVIPLAVIERQADQMRRAATDGANA
jgi:uncharacterized protein